MKRIIYLLAAFVAFGSTAFASNTNTTDLEASPQSTVRGYGNSFIFEEAGIEFSVFADGQFDFYLPNYGPDVSVGINTPGFSLSFNTGYDYNPYVQYDSYGAIIQIENTPIYYDYYGRVNQIGNIVIQYNTFGRISRLGGLYVYYKNNVFYRYDGFINSYNRAYVYRPWHRFYSIPTAQYCVINVKPYRQYYSPVRHIYYRPYTNNVRYFNRNGRRSTTVNTRYVQTPRNRAERALRTQVQRNNRAIVNTRATRSRSAVTRTTTTRTPVTRTTRTTTTTRTVTPNRTSNRSTARQVSSRNVKQNVTRSNRTVSNKMNQRTSVKKPSSTKSRTYNKSVTPSAKQRSVTTSRTKSSSVKTRSNSSRTSNQSSTRSRTSRSRG